MAYGGEPTGAAIVTTLRNAGTTIDSFVAYHLAIGFAHIYLIFDDPADPELSRLASHPHVTAMAHDSALRRAWTGLRLYAANADHVDREVMARQVLNVEHVMNLARQRGFAWLLHIDSDELFLSPNESAAAHFAWLDAQPFETVVYQNYEAVPEADDIADCFREVDLFKVPAALRRQPTTAEGMALAKATPQFLPNFYHYYDNGKSAVRLAAKDMLPKGVHAFIRPRGTYVSARSPLQSVLHYACCGFEAFWTKYVTLGRFADRWWDKYDIAAAIGTFHLEARDVVCGGDREAARRFYRERIALQDAGRIQALIDRGFLARIATPRELLTRSAGKA